MIGIDTNVLLRLIVNDDPRQRRQAVEFINGLSDEKRGYVGLVVLTEMFWALTSRYRYTKAQALEAIRLTTESGNLEIEELSAVVSAIRIARDQNADFADIVIAGRNRGAGCTHTVTFDQLAAKAVPSMELLS